jgi:hypothetical protein
MDREELKRFSRIAYYVCLGLLAALGILCVIAHFWGFQLAGRIPGKCVLHEMTGYYCPGCGGTRAVDALLKGQLVKSFLFHPVVVYTLAGMLAFVVSHTLNILTREKIPAMMFRVQFFYVMIGVILLQWIIKNAIYFFTGVQII